MPTIYVVAGPNGIGKTTSSFDVLPKNIPLINSDEQRYVTDLKLLNH